MASPLVASSLDLFLCKALCASEALRSAAVIARQRPARVRVCLSERAITACGFWNATWRRPAAPPRAVKFVMFGDAARFGNGLRPVPVSSDGTLFAFAKSASESAAHVGPGAYFSTSKEDSR